jgi:hydrogenase expression/formation protein HypD
MKFVDEYRDRATVQTLVASIHAAVKHPWTIMEICGGQTHAIVKHGIDALLPQSITLVHGPGCPVCVTSIELIDRAVAIASRPDVIFTSFGDMLRVPGSSRDLLTVKASGGDVRIVYSPLDAVTLAARNPDRRVVFFAVGFETTAPANAMAAVQAKRMGLTNFFLLTAHVLVPPAIEAILGSPANRVQGFLAAGHVCTVMGYEEYVPLAARYHTPIVVTGFEPVDILQGILLTVRQLEEGRAEVENPYSRVVRREGNPGARAVIADVFETVDRTWRGIGPIPQSGYRLRSAYATLDAEQQFDVGHLEARESPLCIAGNVLQGISKPHECPAFGRECTPEHPLGAPMVSSEGACAAYYRYGALTHGR